jgi:hypothetical protein
MSALPIDASQVAVKRAVRPDAGPGLGPRPLRPRLVLLKGQAQQVAREQRAREQGAREQGAREQGAREQGAREQAPRDATRRPAAGRGRYRSDPGPAAVTVTVGPAPLRLTRRGRLAVGAALALAAAAAASLVIVTASGGAQASDHGQARGGYAGMREIVVRPGQTLWSIAAAAEPSADPRVVIQQIMSVNSLTNAQIQAGQLLWVPR